MWILSRVVIEDMEMLGWVSGGYSRGVGGTYAVTFPEVLKLRDMV